MHHSQVFFPLCRDYSVRGFSLIWFFRKTYHQTPPADLEGWRVGCTRRRKRPDFLSFLFTLPSTNLDLSPELNKTPGRPDMAARGLHAPPPEWRVARILRTDETTAGRSLWWCRWFEHRATREREIAEFFFSEGGGGGFSHLVVFLGVGVLEKDREDQQAGGRRAWCLESMAVGPSQAFFRHEPKSRVKGQKPQTEKGRGLGARFPWRPGLA